MDVETHKQTLARPREILWKRRKDYGNQRDQGHHKSQLTCAHSDSQGLTCQPESMHGIDLGSLHICYCCVALSSRGTLTVGAGAVSDSVMCFWDPSSY